MCWWTMHLKLSQNKKDLNDVTAAPFLVSFSQLPAAKKDTENGAAATSLRSFLFCDDFSYMYILTQTEAKKWKSGKNIDKRLVPFSMIYHYIKIAGLQFRVKKVIGQIHFSVNVITKNSWKNQLCNCKHSNRGGVSSRLHGSWDSSDMQPRTEHWGTH